VAAGSIPYVSRQLESRSLSSSWPVALWRKGDKGGASDLRFHIRSGGDGDLVALFASDSVSTFRGSARSDD